MSQWVEVQPLTDEPADLQFWRGAEWAPKVGDRVRYQFRAECPGVYGMVAPVGHPPEYDGMIGTIYDAGVEPASHPFCVRLDEGSLTRAVQAAVCELEPLS